MEPASATSRVTHARRAELADQPLGVLGPAHARKHLVPPRIQPARARLSDAGRSAGNQNPHVIHSLGPALGQERVVLGLSVVRLESGRRPQRSVLRQGQRPSREARKASGGPREQKMPTYSPRRATIGSTAIARRAGM